MITAIKDVVSYEPNFIDKQKATSLFEQLMCFPELTNMMEIELISGEKIQYDFGKTMFLDDDLIAANHFPNKIWGNTMKWPDFIIPLKKQIEEFTGHQFKTCVCIYYPNGNSGIDYHSDKVAFGNTDVIPSISLGEERIFYLRENITKTKHDFLLEHGSLLIMKKGCQDNYEHSLPKNAKYLNPRINLTFRKYGF